MKKTKTDYEKETDSTYIRHHILYHSFLCRPHLDHSGWTIQGKHQCSRGKNGCLRSGRTCSADLAGVLRAFYKGFVDKADIIVFILIIGGAFWIVNDSKAFDIGTVSFLGRARKMENNRFLRKIGVENFLLTSIMLLFSIFGAVFGMSEETIAFCLVLVPMAISMGYDSITGVCMVFVAAGLGFAGSDIEPVYNRYCTRTGPVFRSFLESNTGYFAGS